MGTWRATAAGEDLSLCPSTHSKARCAAHVHKHRLKVQRQTEAWNSLASPSRYWCILGTTGDPVSKNKMEKQEDM